MEARIQKIIDEKINPSLSKHYGNAVLTGTIDGVVYIKLNGSCASCPSAQDTMEKVVKKKIMDNIPEVKDVALDTSVSQDLLDMAKKLLK